MQSIFSFSLFKPTKRFLQVVLSKRTQYQLDTGILGYPDMIYQRVFDSDTQTFRTIRAQHSYTSTVKSVTYYSLLWSIVLSATSGLVQWSVILPVTFSQALRYINLVCNVQSIKVKYYFCLSHPFKYWEIINLVCSVRSSTVIYFACNI